MFKGFLDWVRLADLDAARSEASARIVARYARGNTSIQNGLAMDENGLARLSAAADRAMDRLRRSLPRR